MTVPSSRESRRRQRQPVVQELLGDDAEPALDILELTELAWHDCYDEISLPDAVIDDIYVCSQGRLTDFARAARLAVQDSRDLRIWADDIRSK